MSSEEEAAAAAKAKAKAEVSNNNNNNSHNNNNNNSVKEEKVREQAQEEEAVEEQQEQRQQGSKSSHLNPQQSSRSANNNNNNDEDLLTTSGGYNSEEEEEDNEDLEGEIHCICGFTEDDGFTIQCEKCFVWQHIVCVGINKNELPEVYYCDKCDPRPLNAELARSIQAARLGSADAEGAGDSRSSSLTPTPQKKPRGRPPNKKRSMSSSMASLGGAVSSLLQYQQIQAQQQQSAQPIQPPHFGLFHNNSNHNNNGNVVNNSSLSSLNSSASQLNNLIATAAAEEHHPMGMSSFDYSATFESIERVKQAPSLDEQVKEFFEQCQGEVLRLKKGGILSTLESPVFQVRRIRQRGFQRKNLPPKFGLFALKTLQVGTPILEFMGEVGLASKVCPEHIFRKSFVECTQTFVLFHERCNDLCLDARKYGNESRFVRRSCRPNVEMKWLIVEDEDEESTSGGVVSTSTASSKKKNAKGIKGGTNISGANASGASGSVKFRIVLVAKSVIHEGEEIVLDLDYAHGNKYFHYGCACGNPDFCLANDPFISSFIANGINSIHLFNDHLYPDITGNASASYYANANSGNESSHASRKRARKNKGDDSDDSDNTTNHASSSNLVDEKRRRSNLMVNTTNGSPMKSINNSNNNSNNAIVLDSPHLNWLIDSTSSTNVNVNNVNTNNISTSPSSNNNNSNNANNANNANSNSPISSTPVSTTTPTSASASASLLTMGGGKKLSREERKILRYVESFEKLEMRQQKKKKTGMVVSSNANPNVANANSPVGGSASESKLTSPKDFINSSTSSNNTIGNSTSNTTTTNNNTISAAANTSNTTTNTTTKTTTASSVTVNVSNLVNLNKENSNNAANNITSNNNNNATNPLITSNNIITSNTSNNMSSNEDHSIALNSLENNHHHGVILKVMLKKAWLNTYYQEELEKQKQEQLKICQNITRLYPLKKQQKWQSSIEEVVKDVAVVDNEKEGEEAGVIMEGLEEEDSIMVNNNDEQKQLGDDNNNASSVSSASTGAGAGGGKTKLSLSEYLQKKKATVSNQAE